MPVVQHADGLHAAKLAAQTGRALGQVAAVDHVPVLRQSTRVHAAHVAHPDDADDAFLLIHYSCHACFIYMGSTLCPHPPSSPCVDQ